MIQFLLRPWVTPRIELTALDELLGAAEMLGLFLLVCVIYGFWPRKKKRK